MKKKRRIVKVTILLLASVILICLFWHGKTRYSWKKGAITASMIEPITETVFDGELRVGAFNIAHGRGAAVSGSNWTDERLEERLDRLHAIADLIIAEDLDLVILNEVDFSSAWSGNVNQTQIIAERAKLNYVVEQTNYKASMPFFQIHFGNAILSRYPIFQPSLVELPVLKKFENTLFGAKHGMVAGLLLRSDLFIQVLPVHFEHRDEGVRKKSLERLLAETGSERFLIGDFNMTPDIPDQLLAAPTGPTFPSKEPTRRIDWILHPLTWQCVESRAVTTDLSDHSFVVATFRLK